MYCVQWTVAQHEADQTLKQFLSTKHVSKRTLASVKFDGGSLLCNEKEVTVRKVVQSGDVVRVVFPREQTTLTLDATPLSIIYEDEAFVIVDKEAGVSTIPSREHPEGSVANRFVAHLASQGVSSTFHAVNRLDRDTSGLIVIAKHRYIHSLFALQQRSKSLQRTYEALVAGTFLPNEIEGTIVAPIGRKDTSIIEREVRGDGQYACTHYRVLKQGEDWSRVRMTLDTGRTHQIRVHFAHLGHPLLGDDLYGGPTTTHVTRQALHCTSVSCIHPLTGRQLTFHSPFPVELLP
ncbi:RluA family pseudouridine synthase [Bacillus fonticola]|uniref:RluA family pseudouridine synthase n=1 Tax=Bacillus fonticola TaxID=2728853 RepID=UPI0014728A00|nr:RluA family pseudouridine synthase [Bacillus fonticola]